MKSFFSLTADDYKQPRLITPHCGLCGLHRACVNGKMGVFGEGTRKTLIVADHPGIEGDNRNRPLRKEVESLLDDALSQVGWELYQDCWVTTALRCRTAKDEAPSKKQLSYCTPYMDKALRELQPELIILLGTSAVSTVIGKYWKENPGGAGRWAGYQIPSQVDNCWICPTYHPDDFDHRSIELYRNAFNRHIKSAIECCVGRPWDTPPKYLEKCEIVYDEADVVRLLNKMQSKGGSIAFDYETDRLKPEHRDSRIVCCSVCWMGKKTIAFPWRGAVKQAMRDLLRDPSVGKIASNKKFEDRWTAWHLNTHVRNWVWDTLLAGHALDYRDGVSGLKFQSFARLGFSDYASHIAANLKPEGQKASTYDQNNIHKIAMDELLTYNALDSLLEFYVASEQIKESGLDPSQVFSGGHQANARRGGRPE